MVIGDFNDDIDSKEMEKFMEDNLLIDIIADTHEAQPPRTYMLILMCVRRVWRDLHT